MKDSETHECYTCGYTWDHGKHGGHRCTDRLVEQNKRLKVVIAERELKIDNLTALICKVHQQTGIVTSLDSFNVDLVKIMGMSPEQCFNHIRTDAIRDLANKCCPVSGYIIASEKSREQMIAWADFEDKCNQGD